MKSLPLASLLLATTCLAAPAALAQTGAPTTAGGGQTSAPLPTPDQTPGSPQGAPQGVPQAQQTGPGEAAPAQSEQVEVSTPGGGDIVVVGRANGNIIRTTPQVVSVLSAADIARTGEGDIAGALQRVTGLSVVGNGFVYVRGLGDRYSLALLNGSPLPSPEPLKRVVPLDIFPTDVIASSLVQKSYSVNYPGEFGGGVINLTTKAIPDEPFLSIGGAISGDSETTGNLFYTYYGSKTDWSGFDSGRRDIPGPLQAALNSGKPILEGANFTRRQIQDIAISLANANTTLLQTTRQMRPNLSGDISAGETWDIGGARLGMIIAGGLKNAVRTRQTLQQLSLNADLSGTPQTNYNRVVSDEHAVANLLVGYGLEFGDQRIRWTNLYIRDTIKQARLALGTDENQQGRDITKQDTAWYERQLLDTQLVGEFKFGDLGVEARGGYANTQREAPYEREFTYVRTNQPGDPTGGKFVNDLGGNKGDATVAFSNLNEDLYSGALDLTYRFSPELKIGVGYAYSDTERTSTRREFQYRATNLPIPVQQERPDYLTSDYTIQTYGITLLETSAQDGTAAFDAKLRTHAGYGQVIAQPFEALNITAGVRYENGKQTVTAIDLFNSGLGTQFNTNIRKDYWLPAVTLTYELQPQMQVRLSGSRTIARPQFRELIRQVYVDTDSNRTFQGNPSLVDSRLWNAEARYEWFFARDQRFTLAGFYKKLDKPIEAFSSILSSDITTSFANAPKADLYGAEVEAQKYFDLSGIGDPFFATRRLALIANYTYTKSKLKVSDGDVTVVNGVALPATDFFRDGAPLTGQSDHLVNLQVGFEDKDHLSQQTFLFNYATKRVTTRGPSGQPDVYEKPGLRIDFVAREGVKIAGLDSEIKFEARNITATKYQEFQSFDDRRIYYNRYDVGALFSLGLGIKF